MRNTAQTDGLVHLNLLNQHWTRSMLPGMAGVLRLYSEFGLLNHSHKNLQELLQNPGSKPLGCAGLFSSSQDQETLQNLKRRGIPAVNISSADPPEDIPGVFVDNYAVGRMAAEHLLKLGTRHFACLDVGEGRMSELRFTGFQERILEAHPDAEIPRLRGFAAEFARNFKEMPKPAALFCVTDNRARAAANVALQQGLKIPADLAIVGVDNDPFECEMTRVPLSSVSIPFEEIGAQAMQTLLKMLRGEEPEIWRKEVQPDYVVTRLSSDPMIFDDELVTHAIRLLRQPRETALNVAGLAEELGVSRRTLEIRFKRAGVGTAHRLIHQMRMERAARLLMESRLTVAEVSRKIGIQDHRRFGQLFQERYGQTPGQYRRVKA